MNKMTTFFKDATSKVSSGIKKASMLGTAAVYTAHANMLNVYAEEVSTIEGNSKDMDGIMSRILDFIFMIFRYAGILLLVWAIIQIVLAFKNDDADSKQKGMVLAVIAVILITMSFAIKPILKAVGFGYVEATT